MTYKKGDKLIFKSYNERPPHDKNDYRQPYPGHAPYSRFEPYQEYKIIWVLNDNIYISNYNCRFDIKNIDDEYYIEKWFYTPADIRRLKLEKLKEKN